MPDEWGLGQIHEEVQMVAELLEEAFLQIILQGAAQQLAHLVELCRRIAPFHHLALNADGKAFLAELVAEGDYSVVVFCQHGSDDVRKQFECQGLCALRGQYVGILELPPHLHWVHLVLDAELLPLVVVLIEGVEVGDAWLLVVLFQVVEMCQYLVADGELLVCRQPFPIGCLGTTAHGQVAHGHSFLF